MTSMSAKTVPSYNRIKIAPEMEVKMIGVLRKTGQPFKAISVDEYYISQKQCDALKKNKVPYTVV